MTDNAPHQHEFLNTFVRTSKSGQKFIVFVGERDDDEQVMMCECGEELPSEDATQ